MLLYLIYRRYRIDHAVDILKERCLPDAPFKVTRSCIAELILCVMHSPPMVNIKFFVPMQMDKQSIKIIEYTSDMFLTLVCMMRIYLGWRYFTRYSKWNPETSEVA